MMPAKLSAPVPLYRGDTFDLPIVLTRAGSAWDLTAAYDQFKAQARKTVSASEVIAEFEVDTSRADLGELVLYLDEDATYAFWAGTKSGFDVQGSRPTQGGYAGGYEIGYTATFAGGYGSYLTGYAGPGVDGDNFRRVRNTLLVGEILPSGDWTR